MAFRIAFIASYTLFILNLDQILKIGAFNGAVKAVMAIAGLAFIFSRPANVFSLSCMVLTTVLIFLLATLTTYPGFQWSLLLGALNQYIVIYLFISAKPTKKDAEVVLVSAAWLAVACSLIGLIYDVIGLKSMFSVEFNTGQARFGGSLNPAFLGGLAMSGMLASLLLADQGKSKYYALLAANFFVMILTGARVSLLVGLVVCSFSFFLSPSRNMQSRTKGIVIAFYAALLIGPLAYLRYAARLGSSGMSGRDIMWPWLHELSAMYPVSGIGFGHQFWSTPRAIFIQFGSNAAHNDYLRLLVEIGPFGVGAFYFLLIVSFFISLSKWGTIYSIPVLSLSGFLIVSITDNALSTPSCFLIFVAAYFYSAGYAPASRKQPMLIAPDISAPRRRFGAEGVATRPVDYLS